MIIDLWYKTKLECVGAGTRFLGRHISVLNGRKNRTTGIRIGRDCQVYDYCRFYNDDWPNSWIQIGDNNHFNYNCFICGTGGLTIGDNCLFGPDVKIIPANHNIDGREPIIGSGHVFEPVKINDGVFIGAGAIILPGVTIGTGAVVGAGSVVTSNVDAFMVVAGVPARLLRMR
jgi:acetyltransferase-like isoleucine patch superfamily enzyme